MVAASVSGVYRCVASNAAGTDQLDHHFYVSGDVGQKRALSDTEACLKSHIFRTNREWKQEEMVGVFRTGEVRRTGLGYFA